ncbi:MAG: lipid asymmetry maintenance ABC transporter permease subunit MlaE [Pseudomonadota bacterium]|nr:lipid asymmetry maintenance ABC transporter permease subunit MlaE [Pseudomonadota bacterium]|tara:strand:+ start:1385 stop:2158 length:774 start_codon:yes stop_codon:yes gene_type:complete
MNKWIINLLLSIGLAISRAGKITIFFINISSSLPRIIFTRTDLVIKQIYNAGTLSLVIIMVSAFFVGMVLGLQGYDSLAKFDAETSVGAISALGLFKELGPVVTALLFSGRAGTAIASEIGLMRTTDQLSAMEMMAVDPIDYVVVPRFIGGILSMPLLAAIFNVIGIAGTCVVAINLMGVDSGVFWSQLISNVDLTDITEGIFKSIVFGIAASLIAVYEGYTCSPSAEGIGLATTRTVVSSAVAVLILDYLITSAII